MTWDQERLRPLVLAALVLVLLGGTTAAFAVAQMLKLERAPITAPRFTKHFSPGCDCPRPVAVLALRLRKADRVDAAIVDPAGEVVRRLAEGEPHRIGPLAFRWDGRDDSGTQVSDGRYRLRLRLSDARRTIVIPSPVFVDTKPPRVRRFDVMPPVFSPDDDQRSDRVRISYAASEPARGTLFVDGARVRSGKLRAEGAAAMFWDGAVGGRVLDQGTYGLTLVATDRAGNSSEPTRSVAVRLRFVTILPLRLTAKRGGVVRLRVSADASAITWTISSRKTGRIVLSGEGRPGTIAIRLPRRVQPGRYLVRAIANDHPDTAALRVTAR